jgi:hypothetical protein
VMTGLNSGLFEHKIGVTSWKDKEKLSWAASGPTDLIFQPSQKPTLSRTEQGRCRHVSQHRRRCPERSIDGGDGQSERLGRDESSHEVARRLFVCTALVVN